MKPGDRIKTNRRDAVTLAQLFRGAVSDLVWAWDTAAAVVRKKRQQLLSFLLRHGRIYNASKHRTRPMHAGSPHRRSSIRPNRLSSKRPSTRLQLLAEQLHTIVPNWSMPLSGCRVHEGDAARRLISGRAPFRIILRGTPLRNTRSTPPLSGSKLIISDNTLV